MSQEETVPFEETETWDRARKFVRGIGDLSSSFSTCIRALLGGGKIAPGSRYTYMSRQYLEQLLRSPTVVSHLYYAAHTYHEDKLREMGVYTPMEMIEVFSPQELAAILTIFYMHRKFVARCDKKDWGSLSAMMQQYVDLAIPLGNTIPSIGPMRALITASARFLGWGSIMMKDPKGFKKYKVAMKVRGVPYDLKEEMATWGTTHVHIGTVMFQNFGFGIEAATGYMGGLLTSDLSLLGNEEKRFKVAQLWLDELIINRSVPSESLGDDFLLSDDELDKFVEFVKNLLDVGSQQGWLDRRRDDISKQSTPNLKYEYERFGKIRRKGEAQSEQPVDDEVAGEEAGT